MNERNKRLLIRLLLVAIITYILLFAGVRFVLDHPVTARNILAYIGFSVMLGLISAALSLMKPRIAYSVFNLGILIGFIAMYRAFFSDLSGWEELSGLLSLFIWILIGLGTGLLAQFGLHLFHRFKKSE